MLFLVSKHQRPLRSASSAFNNKQSLLCSRSCAFNCHISHSYLKVEKSKAEKMSNVPQLPSLKGLKPRQSDVRASVSHHHQLFLGKALHFGVSPAAFSFTFQEPTVLTHLTVLSHAPLPLLLLLLLHRIKVSLLIIINFCPIRPWPNCFLLITHLPFPTTHTHPSAWHHL